MIKKYAVLILLAFNSLNADLPTCENSPEPLIQEQINFCKNAKAFAALARQKPNTYDFFEQAAIRQVNACINRGASPAQIKHIEAVVALELMSTHQARHTWQRSAKRVAGEIAIPLIKLTGTVLAVTQTGQALTLTLGTQTLEVLLPTHTQATLNDAQGTQNSIILQQQQLSIWQNLTQTTKKILSAYDPRSLSTTQLIIVSVVIAAEAGYYVYLVHKDMHEPLPLVFFETKADVNRYIEEHGFSCDYEQTA